MRWDAARMQRAMLGGIWLLWPLCAPGHAGGVAAGLALLLFIRRMYLPSVRYPYPRKQGGAAGRIFFAVSIYFFLLAMLQHLLLAALHACFSVSPADGFLSLSIALFFALPLAARVLSLPIKKIPAIIGGGCIILLTVLIFYR